jgi:hypothetical protein
MWKGGNVRGTKSCGQERTDCRHYEVIDTERSHLDRWLEDWTKKSICVKCCADIRQFVFFSDDWVCGKNYFPPPDECAVKIILLVVFQWKGHCPRFVYLFGQRTSCTDLRSAHNCLEWKTIQIDFHEDIHISFSGVIVLLRYRSSFFVVRQKSLQKMDHHHHRLHVDRDIQKYIHGYLRISWNRT